MGRRYKGRGGNKALRLLQEKRRKKSLYKINNGNKPSGDVTKETEANRDYFNGMQKQLLDNRTDAQFKGLLMSGGLPVGWNKQDVRAMVMRQRHSEIWKEDGHISVEIIERKDKKGFYFPVLYCNKIVDKQQHVFTVFGELRESYEDAEKLAERSIAQIKENWKVIGFKKSAIPRKPKGK